MKTTLPDPKQNTRRSVRLVGIGLGVLGVLLLLEMASFLVVTSVPHFSTRTYSPPQVRQEDYAKYLTERDPVLGWPGKTWLKENTDATGARKSPANQTMTTNDVCLSVFGDSFAFGDDVSDTATWTNILADDMKCPVANFGVGGYGTDQALLRLEQMIKDGTDIGKWVILGIYPDDLNRTVNQWRYLRGGDPFGFKPVFNHGADGYSLVPVFDGDFADFTALADTPESFLTAEQYLPDARVFFRKTSKGFPFTLTLARIVLREISSIRSFGAERKIFWNYPTYHDGPDGPSKVKVATNKYILDRYWNLCQSRDLNCAVLLIPDPELVYQRQEMQAHNLNWLLQDTPAPFVALDATQIFSDIDDICQSLTNPDACQGHFNEGGNRRLAAFVASKLAAQIKDGTAGR